MTNLTNVPDDPVIGYSAFDRREEWYEYVEDSCYLADSPETLAQFLEGCWALRAEYRVEAVRLSDIVKDYGVSSGHYAMESEALARFRRVADRHELCYRVEPYPDASTPEKTVWAVEVASRSRSQKG